MKLEMMMKILIILGHNSWDIDLLQIRLLQKIASKSERMQCSLSRLKILPAGTNPEENAGIRVRQRQRGEQSAGFYDPGLRQCLW